MTSLVHHCGRLKSQEPQQIKLAEKKRRQSDVKMSTVGQNVEHTSPKQNSKPDEIAEDDGPKHNAKNDAQNPPTKSLNIRGHKGFIMTGRRLLPRRRKKLEIVQVDQPDKWCIYRVPSKLRKVNEAAYTPQLLSIGPFHHGKPELKDMETHKQKYYEDFRKRRNKSEDELKQFINTPTRQEKILPCYAGTIELEQFELDIDLEEKDEKEKKDIIMGIILVDACFIIELFLRNFCKTENHKNDYILRSPWLRKAVEQDLILFENQLPYSLLQELYKEFAVPVLSSCQHCKEEQKQTHRQSSTNDLLCCLACCLHCSRQKRSNDHSIDIPAETAPDPLLKLTCEFFKDYRKGKSIKNGVKPKHFTDLVRHFRCPDKDMDWEHKSTPVKNICEHNSTPLKNIYYAAMKLKASGVKFSPLKDGPLIIEKGHATTCQFNFAFFRSTELKLTPFHVEDETECVVRNIMALEQFVYPDRPYICNYFLLLDQLVDTVDDVDLLVENKVILNRLGSNEAVAKLVNRLCEQIMDDKSCHCRDCEQLNSSCYCDVCEQLNNHYENSWNRCMATLKRVYFKDLWTGSSTVLGVVVLIFTVSATILSIIKL